MESLLKVIVTDLAEVCELIQLNISLNALEAAMASESAVAVPLAWAHPTPDVDPSICDLDTVGAWDAVPNSVPT